MTDRIVIYNERDVQMYVHVYTHIQRTGQMSEIYRSMRKVKCTTVTRHLFKLIPLRRRNAAQPVPEKEREREVKKRQRTEGERDMSTCKPKITSFGNLVRAFESVVVAIVFACEATLVAGVVESVLRKPSLQTTYT